MPAATDELLQGLDPRSHLYWHVSHTSAEVDRALVLATWAQVAEEPPGLQRRLLEVVSAPDPRAPLAYAAAARVLAAHAARGGESWAVPYLELALQETFVDVSVDVGHLDSIARPRLQHGIQPLPAVGPSARLEAINALVALGVQAQTAIPLLERLASLHPALPGEELGEDRTPPALAEAYWEQIRTRAHSAALTLHQAVAERSLSH